MLDDGHPRRAGVPDPDAPGHRVRPQIDVELPLAQAAEGFARMHEGRTAGKIVFTV
jgi:NADPH:quinone reductase-like Zn-dependent oxidoreductase